MADKHDTPALPQQQFTLEDVLKIVQSAVAEMKKPNEYEQKKLDDERKGRQKAARQRISLAFEEEKARLSKQRGCPHVKLDKNSAWAGQVNSDGYVRFICLVCGMVAPEVKAPMEWIQNGVNAQDPFNNFMKTLTLKQIEAWHKQAGPKPAVQPRGIAELPEEWEKKVQAIP